MGFTEKTNYLLETKSLLKDRINSLGGSITSGTTFRDYLVWLDSLYEALDKMTITGLPDSLEGKCEQDGTPTPDSPVPINITTGRQVVSVCGKNHFSDTLRQGVTVYNTGEWNNSNARITSTDWITLKAGTYTISAKTSYTASAYLQISNVTFDTSGNFYNISGVSGVWKRLPFTFTTPIDLNWKCNVSFNDSAVITPDLVYDIQIEEGTTATTYEEYKGNDYEINLGKNLFDGIIEQGNYDGSTGNKTGSNAFYRNANKIPVQPSTTYTFSLNGVSQRYVVLFYKGDGTFISQNSSYSTGTFTTPNNAYYVNFRCFQSDYTDDYATLKVQLEKGSSATTYSPYKTPIYLGEMRNTNNVVIAKNYIFRNTTENPLYDSNLEEGQWYIHKEIGRVVLNGSENWTNPGTNTSVYQYNTSFLSIALTTAYCTHAKQRLINSNIVASIGNNEFVLQTPTGFTYSILYFRNDNIIGSTANWKTWLSSHNVEVYYVLATPTNTLIEDEELINQLNEIDIFTVISEDFYN